MMLLLDMLPTYLRERSSDATFRHAARVVECPYLPLPLFQHSRVPVQVKLLSLQELGLQTGNYRFQPGPAGLEGLLAGGLY